jgi:hypothetical protein
MVYSMASCRGSGVFCVKSLETALIRFPGLNLLQLVQLLNVGLNSLRLKSEPLQRMRKAMLVLTQRVFSPTSRLLAAATLQNTLNQTLAHPL